MTLKKSYWKLTDLNKVSLYSGFIFIITITVFLAYLVFNSFSAVNDNFNLSTTSNFQKLQAATQMRIATRERAITLWNMAQSQDFEQKLELSDRFYSYGSSFLDAREIFINSPMLPAEQQLFHEIEQEVGKRAPKLRDYAELLLASDDFEEHVEGLFKLIASQYLVATLLDDLIVMANKDAGQASKIFSVSTFELLQEFALGVVFFILLFLIWGGLVISHERRQTREIEQQNLQLAEEKNHAIMANEAKNQFVSNMSHELRTPMHAIRSFTQLAYKRIQDDKVRQWLSNVIESSERLTNLLNLLLDLSRLETGKITADIQTVEVVKLVRAAVESMSLISHEKNISLRLTAAEDLYVNLDAELINQMLVILIGNAVKYSQEGSAVEIVVESTEDFFELKIIDEGVGFPADEIEQAFEMFYQTSRTRRGNGGVGLGLTICKEIVDLHQGQISVQSPPAEREAGTQVSVKFPLNLQISTAQQGSLGGVIGSCKVLVIDDDPVILRLIKGFLEFDGHQVLTESSGENLETLLKVQKTDVLITDINLPGENGFSVMQRAREINPELIVFSLTGDEHLKKDMQKTQADDNMVDFALFKPIEKKQLTSNIRRLLQKKAVRLAG